MSIVVVYIAEQVWQHCSCRLLAAHMAADLMRPQNFEVSSHGVVSRPSRNGLKTILGSKMWKYFKIKLARGNTIKIMNIRLSVSDTILESYPKLLCQSPATDDTQVHSSPPPSEVSSPPWNTLLQVQLLLSTTRSSLFCASSPDHMCENTGK